MKRLFDYKTFINEALAPSQFRKYMKLWTPEMKKRYESIFQKAKQKYDGDKNAYRIYLPMEEAENPVEKEIKDLLNDNGYVDVDYMKGKARFKEAKNLTNIGKILNKLSKKDDKAKVLKKKFIEDPIRKSGKNLMVIVSRHPYDIAGSDTDRKWTNCMTIGIKNEEEYDHYYNIVKKLKSELDEAKKKGDDKAIKKLLKSIDKIEGFLDDGDNVGYLYNDIEKGSLIAYLVKEGDFNIEDPIANIAIKPYHSILDKNEIILVADNKMYGQENPAFKKTVDKWLSEDVNHGRTEGMFCLSDDIYSDNYWDEDTTKRNVYIGKQKDIMKYYNEVFDQIDKLEWTEFDSIVKDILMYKGDVKPTFIEDFIQKINENISQILSHYKKDGTLFQMEEWLLKLKDMTSDEKSKSIIDYIIDVEMYED